MTFTINKAQILPVREDEDGTIRIGKTRITFDTLIAAFNSGYTAEEIVINFDTLDLAEVYSIIGYYLGHKYDLDAYLQARDEQAQELRNLFQAHQKQADLRERLLARKQSQKTVE